MVDCDEQMLAGEALAVIVGVGLTVTLTVRVATQPEVAPVKVYTVVVPGVTLTVLVVVPPGFQV